MSRKKSKLKIKKHCRSSAHKRRDAATATARRVRNAAAKYGCSSAEIEECVVALPRLQLEQNRAYQEIDVDQASHVMLKPRILSLFDGIGSALVALNGLGVKPQAYTSALDDIWWYPPLGKDMVRNLSVSSDGDVKPLLAIRHVTYERAKDMIKMGIKTVQDVASLYPPTLLAEQMKYLGKWRAVEIVLDARMHVAQEMMLFAAETQERLETLTKKVITI